MTGAAAERLEVERLVDYWTPLLVRMLAETGVFAAVGDGERTAEELAAACNLDAQTLRRFLRALASRGVVERTGHERYRLTSLGLRLVPGRPGSMSGLGNFKPQELHAWAEGLHSLRTGEASFPAYFGAPMFDWLSERPALMAQFNDSMRRRTATLLDVGLELIDWPVTGTVVDVGGGNGLLLERLLRLRPALRAVLFDLPHVVADAPPYLEAAGVAERVETIGGSFFESAPGGHDLYVLSNILHDWDDEGAISILSSCRAAMPLTGRLRIFETVLREGDVPDLGELLDLHMLVLLGAAERTAEEWTALLERARFTLARIVPTPGFAWIEAAPS